MWSNMCLAIVWSPVTLNKLISGETQGQQRVLSRTWGHVNDMLMLTCETVMRMSSIWSVLLINNPLLIEWIFQLWDMFFIWSFFLSKKTKQTKKQQPKREAGKAPRMCRSALPVQTENTFLSCSSPSSAFILVIYAMHLFDPLLCKSAGPCLKLFAWLAAWKVHRGSLWHHVVRWKVSCVIS